MSSIFVMSYRDICWPTSHWVIQYLQNKGATQKRACVYPSRTKLAEEVDRQIIQVQDGGKFFCPKLYIQQMPLTFLHLLFVLQNWGKNHLQYLVYMRHLTQHNLNLPLIFCSGFIICNLRDIDFSDGRFFWSSVIASRTLQPFHDGRNNRNLTITKLKT